jgi:hypothetical protein
MKFVSGLISLFFIVSSTNIKKQKIYLFIFVNFLFEIFIYKKLKTLFNIKIILNVSNII